MFNVKPKDVGFPPLVYYNENGILQSHTSNYTIYNKKSKKRMYSGFDENIPIHLFIIDRNFHLSKKEAQNILDKYKINKNVHDIELGDSVNVESYKRVRQDFPYGPPGCMCIFQKNKEMIIPCDTMVFPKG